MISAPRGSTKPEAGVIATSPATAPDMIPSTLGLPLTIHSTNIQERAAVAVAIWVTAIAMPALPFAAVAGPAVNPNQPAPRRRPPEAPQPRVGGGLRPGPEPPPLPHPHRRH